MRLGEFLVSPEEIEVVIQKEPGVAGVQVVAASTGDSDVFDILKRNLTF